MIDVHYASLTSQGVQHREIMQTIAHPDMNPVKQGLTPVNGREPMFPFGDSPAYNKSNFVIFIATTKR